MSIQRKSPIIKLNGGLALAGLSTPDFWPVAVDAARVPLTISGGMALAGVGFPNSLPSALKLALTLEADTKPPGHDPLASLLEAELPILVDQYLISVCAGEVNGSNSGEKWLEKPEADRGSSTATLRLDKRSPIVENVLVNLYKVVLLTQVKDVIARQEFREVLGLKKTKDILCFSTLIPKIMKVAPTVDTAVAAIDSVRNNCLQELSQGEECLPLGLAADVWKAVDESDCHLRSMCPKSRVHRWGAYLQARLIKDLTLKSQTLPPILRLLGACIRGNLAKLWKIKEPNLIYLTRDGTNAESLGFVMLKAMANKYVDCDSVTIAGPNGLQAIKTTVLMTCETGRGSDFAASGGTIGGSDGIKWLIKTMSPDCMWLPELRDPSTGRIVDSDPSGATIAELYNKAIDDAFGSGSAAVCIHLMACSKSGLLNCSIEDLKPSIDKYGRRLLIVVDACQWRLGRNFFDEMAQKGLDANGATNVNMLILTIGSKYFGASPYCGAVVLTQQQREDLQEYSLESDFQEFFSNYFSDNEGFGMFRQPLVPREIGDTREPRDDDPDRKKQIRAYLVLSRWLLAISNMKRYFSYSEDDCLFAEKCWADCLRAKIEDYTNIKHIFKLECLAHTSNRQQRLRRDMFLPDCNAIVTVSINKPEELLLRGPKGSCVSEKDLELRAVFV